MGYLAVTVNGSMVMSMMSMMTMLSLRVMMMMIMVTMMKTMTMLRPKCEVSTTADAKFLSWQVPVHYVVMNPLVTLPLMMTKVMIMRMTVKIS